MFAVTVEQMRMLEEKCMQEGITDRMLMEQAGKAAAASIHATIPVSGKRCVVFCGKGNNGGDGFVAARELTARGAKVKIVLADGLPKARAAQEMYEAAYAEGIEIIDLAFSPYRSILAMQQVDIVVDAIYGTGFRGRMSATCRDACKMINKAIAAVFSMDLPSGLEADGPDSDPDAVKADFTIVLDSLKPVHIMPHTSRCCGNVCVVDIGIPAAYKEQLEYRYALVDDAQAASFLPVRAPDSHKGDHGYLLCIVGSRSYMGAAVLACMGALRSGVGYVHLAAVPEVCAAVAAQLPEVTFTQLPANASGRIDASALTLLKPAMERATAVCIGCGLGLDEDIHQVVSGVLERASCPVIVDADGINTVAEHIHILNNAAAPLLLTPHMGELSRLLQMDIAHIRQDRLTLAGNFAARHQVTLLCKDAITFTAPGSMGAYINTTGNAGLAKAGSGDLLAGLVSGLAAQGLSLVRAASAGAYYHGKAADLCARELGQMYMQPSDVARYLSKAYPNL